MIFHSSPINIRCCLLIIQIAISLCDSSLKFRVDEEAQVGSVLGNINNHVMSNLNDYHPYDVSLINDYFEILSNKNLVIKKRIDLETFCSEANLCCAVSQCIVKFLVIINSQNSQRNQIDIEVEVLDINDNKPTFKSVSQTVLVAENTDISTTFLIEGASDSDVSQTNQIQSYQFTEPTMTFSLDNSDLTSLLLVLKKPVDFEQQTVYRGQLSACDGPNRCVKQEIVINIVDVNDNHPVFVKDMYKVEIREDFEVGKVIIAARAIDKDGKQFNKTKYGFYGNNNQYLVNKFKINEASGDIILKSKLAAQHLQNYLFKIYAMDFERTMAGKKDIAEVSIFIIDINDHKPVIKVYTSSRISTTGDSFEIRISENEKPQKLMTITVTDADLGANAKVFCQLKDRTSSLEVKQFNTIYDIMSIKTFDYEQETQIKASFECKDGGNPPESSEKIIKINIDDVNEYAPIFDQSEFHGSIIENRGAGEVVMTVHASDKDGAAVLTYSLEERVTQYFAINPRSGVIKTASVPFDREQIDSTTFQVTVTDSITNTKSAEAMVRISILDENDNDPMFVLSSLQFSISENRPIKSKLNGQLRASDLDKDQSNSFLTFSLLETYDSQLKKCERPYFMIKIHGEVETLTELDRELNPNFTLTIEVRDRGNPPRYSRANATVTVHDVNDNSPQWIYPRPFNLRQNGASNIQILNLTESIERGSLIMKLKAHDPDQNEAGTVSYYIFNNQQSMFSLNDSTGELRTEKSPLQYGPYQLDLRAKDHGNPQCHSDSRILINVLDSGKWVNINLTIIIGMVAITTLISIFLIVAIICVRRRPRFHQSYLGATSDSSKELQSNQYFLHNQWMYNPSDDAAMSPCSDKESCVYLSNNIYEQHDPLILNSLANSRSGSRIDYPLVLPSTHQASDFEHKFGLQPPQNIERACGTLRSTNGQYYTIDTPNASGITINGHELDGDSADSGKGASEVDLRLQYHLNNGTRNYPTMPFTHHSTSSAMFGYPSNMPDSQYFSVTPNQKPLDSRFLTVYSSNVPGKRRIVASKFNSNNNNQCQCFMLPEDDVIQVDHDIEHVPMTTFSQQSIATVKSPTSTGATNQHERNCVYRADMSGNMGYYPHCPYTTQGGASSCVSTSPIQFGLQESLINDQEREELHNSEGDQLDSYSNMFDSKKRNNFTNNSDQITADSNNYSVGIAN